ncbi:MAG: O-antigen ligase family protein [Bacteroidia bacterium]|nr:O-antigen ligase family protein [Bacteroidia bacterium]MCF8426179.1 O-antigen ligase family protein [Bacteroidia bacterium]MCF8445527.1 O-antigen ligase family protein [Bacteroidia bacterium]
MKKYFLILCSISLGILIIEAYFDSKFPIAFNLVLPDTFHRDNRRVSGTLIDPSSFSTAVISFIGIIFFTLRGFANTKNRFLVLFLFIIGFYLIEISGSRQGFISFIILLLGYFWPKFKKEHFFYFAAFMSVLALFAFLFQDQFTHYAFENPNSSISRFVFYKDNNMSTASNDERLNSILGGIEYIKSNFFLYGPGGASYSESYASQFKNEVHMPHNGIIFLWGQYGLLFLVFIYLQYLLLKRAWKVSLMPFFLLFLVQFNFLPNSAYYCNSFLLFFFIDFNYLYSKKNNQELEELG